MLKEAVQSDRRTQGGTCPVAVLVGGGIPRGSTTRTVLEPDDREWLAAAVAPGSPEVLAKIWRVLTEHGYNLGQTSLARHRRRDCRCP